MGSDVARGARGRRSQAGEARAGVRNDERGRERERACGGGGQNEPACGGAVFQTRRMTCAHRVEGSGGGSYDEEGEDDRGRGAVRWARAWRRGGRGWWARFADQ